MKKQMHSNGTIATPSVAIPLSWVAQACRKLSIRAGSKVAGVLSVLAVLMMGVTTARAAWAYTASGPWASFNVGAWTVYQNEWGAPNVYCELYANNAGNFASAGNWTGPGTKGYPHTQGNPNIPIGSYWANASFNFSRVVGATYTLVFDCWTAGHQDELMIEEAWEGPKGHWGTQIAANVTLGGRHYSSIWQAHNGANNVIIFTPSVQKNSGTTDLMACFVWARDRGLLANTTLYEISFGPEITSTSGWQQFTVNSFSASWGPNSSGSIANGTYRIVARHSGKAMDASGGGTANGTQIHQWTYGGGNNQRWTVTNRGNNQYSIIGVASGRAVEVSAWGTANGTKIQLWDWLNGTNQKFTPTATSGGYFRLTPTHATGSCLDVAGVSTSDGALVHLWTYGGGNNQQWAFQAP
jgi:hypothetical protein